MRKSPYEKATLESKQTSIDKSSAESSDVERIVIIILDNWKRIAKEMLTECHVAYYLHYAPLSVDSLE